MTTQTTTSPPVAEVPTGANRTDTPVQKTIGFPKSSDPPPANQGNQTSNPRPRARLNATRVKPKRPKGRLFITLFIAVLVFVVGSKIWSEFGRNQAYGVMEGRVLKIRAPWNGIIESVHVRDGQEVSQGQLLATVNNFEYKNERLRLKHELEIALAELAMRIADIQAREQVKSDSVLELQIDYHQLLGRLHSERAKLQEVSAQYQRNLILHKRKSVSRAEVERDRIQLTGQKPVVTELTTALETLQTSLEQNSNRDESVIEPLVLQQARIESIEAEFDRLSGLMGIGEIRSPVNGRVVRRSQFTGEFVEKNTSLFELLERDSLTAVVYLPQSKADLFAVDETIQLGLPPYSATRTFKVDRIGDQLVSAPASIERFYNFNQKLVPIYAVPLPGQIIDTQGDGRLWLGAEVHLPRFGNVEDPGKKLTAWLTRLKSSVGW